MAMKLDHLYYIYSEGTAFEKHALKDICLEIPDGQFIGVIGHTGSGKSTLIQHLNGLLRATKGTVYYLDERLCAYRQGAQFSWNKELRSGDREKKIAKAEEHCRAMTEMYRRFDEATGYRFRKESEIMVRRQELYCLMVREDFRTLMSKENREFVKREYAPEDVRYFRIRSLMPNGMFRFFRQFLPGGQEK